MNNPYSITLDEQVCSDGMCCFTCVIPEKNEHLEPFYFFLKKGEVSDFIRLLIMSENYKNELYHACRFLDMKVSESSEDTGLKLELRCCIYKLRPLSCKSYPDMAGNIWDKFISGPCLYNEYTAGSSYKKLIYKRDWDAFYVIPDCLEVIQKIYPSTEGSLARERIKGAENVRCATISVNGEETDCFLIPVLRCAHKILYMSENHSQITSLKQAYQKWPEKIQKNLQYHYGNDWEITLRNAMEAEEKDSGKGEDECTVNSPVHCSEPARVRNIRDKN